MHASKPTYVRKPRYARQSNGNAYTEAALLETSYQDMSLSNYFTSNYHTDTHYEAAYNNFATENALRNVLH